MSGTTGIFYEEDRDIDIEEFKLEPIDVDAEVRREDIDPLNTDQADEKRKVINDMVGIRYSCDQCNLSCTKLSFLKKHVEAKHTGIRYPCDQCEYAASTRRDMNSHKRSKHGIISYPCDQCKYAATTPSNLKIHKQSRHERIQYPCDQCEYTGNEQCSLEIHYQNKHEGIRYPCDQCDFTASSFLNVQKHRLTKHIKFHCVLCDTTVEFKTLHELRGHIRLVHPKKEDNRSEDRTVSNVELSEQDKNRIALDFDSLGNLGQVCYTVQNFC